MNDHHFPTVKRLKKALFLFVFSGLIFTCVSAGSGQEKAAPKDSLRISAPDSSANSPRDEFVWRSLSNKAFGVGEKLVFIIRWGPIHAGEAVMEIPEILTLHGRKVYRILSRAYTNRVFSTFFKVRDQVESLMDVDGLFSWQFEKHLREGKFVANIKDVFNQKQHFVVSRRDTISVNPYIQDVLSSLYFVRTQPLVVGESLAVDNYADNKVYQLEVKVLRKERIKVNAGTFNCIVIEPILKSTGIFQQKGKLTVWLTDDARHLPVLMKSKVIVGSFVAELKNYKLGSIE
ncbi:hypothetical protein BMS3Abin05_01617 [bacterium BMS3Abin05]|nr:hypothetical protein BMS3Abin05_01617 [bacterium BMS3Abin05]GBE27073.1 hypothetical protein BMS3Bbin03_00993 [bacterium BMS3Bbin03]HDL78067.1 DUF3108 domain-containing protein [Bacteroidota bacterium]HDZ11184.1 DUF3108 domain-containing protein [Bacteroidota bacterium]